MAGPPIPGDLDGLTPPWLTDVLRRSGTLAPEACVVRVTRDRPARGIAVTSRVARLRLEYAPACAGPASLFAKVVNPDYADREGAALEVRFYRDLAPSVDLPIPRCHHADVDEANRFVLLLEDLTDVTPGHPLDGCDLDQARRLVDDLARLHAGSWGGERLDALNWPRSEFDPDRVAGHARRLGEVWPGFVAAGTYPVEDALDDLLRRTPEESFVAARRRLAGPPWTLIHTDLHVENLLFDRRGSRTEVWFLDWQCARNGNPAWDLVNGVGGNVRPDVQTVHGKTLVSRYHRALTAHPGVEYGRDALRRDLDAAVRWNFLGQVLFLHGFEPESEHDLRTLQREWARVAHAFFASTPASV